MDYVQNGAFARCVRGDTGRAATFNQWMAGDNALRIADDVHYLAATLECLVTQGIKHKPDRKTYDWDHGTIKNYVAICLGGIRLERSLLGTFGEFGASLLDIVSKRADYESLGGRKYFRETLDAVVRKALVETLPACADQLGEVEVLHGKARHWLERLARHPPREKSAVPEGHFIQFVVPRYFSDQLILGFELLTDVDLASAAWKDTAGWFSPRVQHAGKSAFVLDEPLDDAEAYRAEVPGDCLVQVVGIDAPGDAALPHDLSRLTINRPADWPKGYAETMALITYAKRRALNVVKAENKNEPVSARLRLYRNSYKVVASAV